MKIPRALARLAAAIPLAAVLAGAASCTSSPSGSALTYAPAAYGAQVGTVYDCYYVYTPAEVTDLINAGRCPHGSVPTPMPLSWEETYWSYYDSSAYYGTYMPASYRTRYTSTYVVTFGRTYSKQITADSTKGTYKSSTGTIVKGSTVSKLKYSTSSGGKTVHGGGSGSGVSACSMSMTVLTDKGSTSHGGGSGSSTSHSSTTHSGSGSRGGC